MHARTVHTEGTLKVYEQLKNRKKMSPRVAHALRLYNSGAMPTKKAAALAVGLAPQSLYSPTMPRLGATMVSEFGDNIQERIHEKAIDVGALLERLSVQAIATIDHIRREGSSEALRLKAAVDLADRGPRTSKVHKVSVESFTLANKDADALMAAMLESKEAAKLMTAVEGNFEEHVEMKDDEDRKTKAFGDGQAFGDVTDLPSQPPELIS